MKMYGKKHYQSYIINSHSVKIVNFISYLKLLSETFSSLLCQKRNIDIPIKTVIMSFCSFWGLNTII